MKQRLYIDTSVFGGYNAVNIKNGYKQLEIRSPRDFMTYGDND